MERILFCKVNEPYGCFSNFSPHTVYAYGRWYATAEHCFQSAKFIGMDWRDGLAVEKAASPMIAARIGRDRTRPIRPDWDHVKDDVMRRIVRAKVMQHADVRTALLSTGTAEIVEHTPRDAYWGDGRDGKGLNKLGRIYMEIRADLTSSGPFDELATPMAAPWSQHPEIERYSIGWRMGGGEQYLCDWWAWYRGLTASGQAAYRAANVPPPEWEDFYDLDQT